MVKNQDKTQYIEELGKTSRIVDLDGDGNFGNLGTEISKMEAEIEKMKQGLSDEIGLGMLGELRGILEKIKAGVSPSELKILIEQAMNKKKEVNVELNGNIQEKNKEKEKAEKLEKEIEALLEKLKEMMAQKEKVVDTPNVEKPLIAKVISALKSIFEDKPNKTVPTIDNKDKDKDKNIPIEASIIENKKKQMQLKKESTAEPEISQNEQLIGVMKNLANAGEVKLLEEVLNDNKNKLQVEDYAKALDKKVTPDMNIDKLRIELKSRARNNRIKKVEVGRSIEIHKTEDKGIEKEKGISVRLLKAHEKTDVEKSGMERTLDINNNNNKY